MQAGRTERAQFAESASEDAHLKKSLTYSIGALARLTGLSTDAIRSWERRYRIVEPDRTPSGARCYSESDVARLRLARAATERGHPIRFVAAMSDDELRRLIDEGTPAPEPGGDPDARIVLAVLDAIRKAEPAAAERLLLAAALALPPRELVLNVLVPVLHEVGELWEQGRLSVWQEHLLSDLLRGVARSWTRLDRVAPREPSMLFATPPNELHEFGILLASMLATARGFRVFRLGASVPAAEIAAAADRLAAARVVVGLSRTDVDPGEVRAFVTALEARLPTRYELWLGGPLISSVANGSTRVIAAATLEDFDQLLES